MKSGRGLPSRLTQVNTSYTAVPVVLLLLSIHSAHTVQCYYGHSVILLLTPRFLASSRGLALLACCYITLIQFDLLIVLYCTTTAASYYFLYTAVNPTFTTHMYKIINEPFKVNRPTCSDGIFSLALDASCSVK